MLRTRATIGFAGLVGFAFVTTAVALAASISLASNGLGAATSTTPRCTSAGLGVIHNLSGSTVVSVTVSNLPSGCGGATLQATVKYGATTGSGSATVPGGGGSVTVSLAAAPTVALAGQTDLVLTGP